MVHGWHLIISSRSKDCTLPFILLDFLIRISPGLAHPYSLLSHWMFCHVLLTCNSCHPFVSIECSWDHPWRWCWDKAVSTDEEEGKAGSTAGCQLQAHRYPCQQLSEQQCVKDLCADAVQLCFAQPPPLEGLWEQYWWVQERGICWGPCSTAEPRES